MTTAAAPSFACTQCGSRYRLRDESALTDRGRSACPKCGERFGFIVVPAQTAVGGSGPGSGDAVHMTDTVRLSEPSAKPATSHYRFDFHGQGGSLFGIQIVNLFLTLVSLGVYHFWGKVKIRKYLFSQTACSGDRFAYHGTGKELLTGFVKAMLVFGLPYGALGILPELLDAGRPVQIGASLLGGLVFLVFVPIAIAGARRYRLSRTSWRGIRFSFRGRTRAFLKLYLQGTLLTALTLGAYYPYFLIKRQAFLVSHSYFGNQRFGFDGHGSALATRFVICLLLSVLAFSGILLTVWTTSSATPLLLIPFVLGPLWIWFLAAKQRYVWDHTTFGQARFRSTITPRRLLNLMAENLVLLVLTLGFMWPWVTVRTMRFYLTNLTLLGPADLTAVLQDPKAAATTGEGLADFLDTGFELD